MSKCGLSYVSFLLFLVDIFIFISVWTVMRSWCWPVSAGCAVCLIEVRRGSAMGSFRAAILLLADTHVAHPTCPWAACTTATPWPILPAPLHHPLPISSALVVLGRNRNNTRPPPPRTAPSKTPRSRCSPPSAGTARSSSSSGFWSSPCFFSSNKSFFVSSCDFWGLLFCPSWNNV